MAVMEEWRMGMERGGGGWMDVDWDGLASGGPVWELGDLGLGITEVGGVRL